MSKTMAKMIARQTVEVGWYTWLKENPSQLLSDKIDSSARTDAFKSLLCYIPRIRPAQRCQALKLRQAY